MGQRTAFPTRLRASLIILLCSIFHYTCAQKRPDED